MDIIDVFLERHAALRRDIASLEAPFLLPHGVGWDDCVSLDCERLLRDVERFFASFRSHVLAEDRFLKDAGGRLKLDAATEAEFSEGRRAVADIMKLFGAVAFTFDGEHVHRVRELLSRMHEEVEEHLDFEERILFPLLRERLPPEILQESGSRERERAGHGRRAR